MTIQVLQGRLGRTVSFNLKTRDGSAIGVLIILLITNMQFTIYFLSASQDYASVDTSRILNSSVTVVNVDIPIVVDEIAEDDETFSVELSLISPSTRVSIAPATTQVTIVDENSVLN